MVDYNSDYDRDRLAIVEDRLNRIASGGSVIEFGSNNGTTTSLLTARFDKILAIDCMEDAIAQARTRVPSSKVEWLLHDLDRPLPSALQRKFDVAVALEVIEHLISPPNFLSEVRQCLKPGGTLVLSTPNLASLEGVMGRYRAWKTGTAYNAWDTTHKSLFNSAGILRLLKDSGFKTRTVIGYYYSAAPFPIFNQFQVPFKKFRSWPLNRLGFNTFIEALAQN